MKKIEVIERYFEELFPDPKCEINYSNDYELLISIMLSAQTTDKRVNEVTRVLWNKYPNIESLKNANIDDLKQILRPLGNYNKKSIYTKEIATILFDEYNGKIPYKRKILESLPGVGRKTVNVVMLEAFGIAQGIAIDTHAKRISNRLGLSYNTDPSKIEKDLLKIVPKEYYKDVNHLLVWHGRNLCTARKPKCNECPLADYCNFSKLSIV